MAQQTTFDQNDADTICEALAEGRSLLTICEAMGISYGTARQWELDRPEHAANSARAREMGCHYLADECIAIADDSRNDWMEIHDKDGEETGWKVNGEHVQRARLRIDTRMRLIGKWASKLYGEKLALGGADDLPPIRTVSDTELKARINALRDKLDDGNTG